MTISKHSENKIKCRFYIMAIGNYEKSNIDTQHQTISDYFSSRFTRNISIQYIHLPIDIKTDIQNCI